MAPWRVVAAVLLLLSGCAAPAPLRFPPGVPAEPLRVLEDQTVQACQDPHYNMWGLVLRPLLATGGAPEHGYRWSLPDDDGTLRIDNATGMVVGIGRFLGTVDVNVTVTDGRTTARGTVRVESVEMRTSSIPPSPTQGCGHLMAPFQVEGRPLPAAQAGQAYAHSLSASQTVPAGRSGPPPELPWRWNASAELAAACLALDGRTGLVSGVPCAAAGSSIGFRVDLRDAQGKAAECPSGCRVVVWVG